MNEDITYCYNYKCKNTKCERNESHIKQHYVPHSFGFFKECKWWDLPEVYFTVSDAERRQDEAMENSEGCPV